MWLVQAIKKFATDTAIKTTRFNERASSIEETRVRQGIRMHSTSQSTAQVDDQITTFTGDTFTSLPQWKAMCCNSWKTQELRDRLNAKESFIQSILSGLL